jgi:hypothetical protein
MNTKAMTTPIGTALLGAGLILLLFAAAGCDPKLSLYVQGVLTVGEVAKLSVEESSDKAAIDDKSFKLVDAQGHTYAPSGSSKTVQVTRVSEKELTFVVPTGIAPGEASIEVMTQKGLPFTAKALVNRLIAMRDLSGKVWMIAIKALGEYSQYTEVKSGDSGLGSGDGKVSFGPQGWLLASSSRQAKQVKLAAIGASVELTTAYTFEQDVADVVVMYSGQTLVATGNTLSLIEKPTSFSTSLSVSALNSTQTFAVAADRTGKRAVALQQSSSKSSCTDTTAYCLAITPIDTSGSTPSPSTPILLKSWRIQGTFTPAVAISSDGKYVIAVEPSLGKMAFLQDGTGAATESAMNNGEGGPIAVAADRTGTVFYVLNKTTNNLSVVTVAGGAATFGTPIALNPLSTAGSAVGITTSDNGELIALFEHDLVSVDTVTQKAAGITLSNLFTNKQNGEVGGALSIQP